MIVPKEAGGVEEDGAVLVAVVEQVTVRLGGQFAVRPVEGETTVLRVTVPVKPPDGVTVIVELPVAPVLKSAGEVAEIAKSGIKTKAEDITSEVQPRPPHSFLPPVDKPAVGE